MKCDVCGSKKTELLTSWACDTCDFESKTPVADHILGLDKGTDVQRLRQQEAAALSGLNSVARGGEMLPAWYRRGLEWAKRNDMLPGTCAEVAPANQLPDDVAELVKAASNLCDSADEACEFVGDDDFDPDEYNMKHRLFEDVQALRTALDRILYKEQTK